MNAISEILVWQYEVPVVCILSDMDFLVWQYEIPVIDIDGSAIPTTAGIRRRTQIF